MMDVIWILTMSLFLQRNMTLNSPTRKDAVISLELPPSATRLLDLPKTYI